MKEIITFTVASKRIKQLGINLTKEVKDLHDENYNTLLKEIRQDINKWKTSHVHGLEDNLTKMSVLLKEIYRVSAISVKIPTIFFFSETGGKKNILKFIWNLEGLWIAKNNPEKDERSWSTPISWFQKLP